MDQELKAFLEEQFARAELRTAEQFAQAEQRVAEQFGQVAEQFGQVAEQFAEVRTQLGTMNARSDRMEASIRQTQVLVEAVRSDVRLVAEGVMGLNERLEVFQEATAKDFKKIEASIAPYYEELNGRVRVLEAKALRKNTDVLKAVYKKFGKTQGS